MFPSLQGGGGLSLQGGGSPQITANPQPAARVSGNMTTTANPQAGNYAFAPSPAAPPAPVVDNTAAQQAAAVAAQNAAAAQAARYSQYGDPALLNNDIQSYQHQIDGLDGQQSIGLQNLADQYQKGLNNVNYSNQLNERNYNQGVATNVHSYDDNRTGIMNTTNSNANALQRLLGMNGAGNSSAALYAAPYAVAKQGSIDLGQAQKAYGTNQGNLDQTWGDQTHQYKNALDNLYQQNYQGQNGLKASIASTRAQLLDQIAGKAVSKNLANGMTGQAALAARAPYQSQIDQLQQQIAGYGRANPNPVIAAPSINTTPVALTNYVQAKQAPITAGTPGGTPIDPTFLSVLSGQKRDQYGQIVS